MYIVLFVGAGAETCGSHGGRIRELRGAEAARLRRRYAQTQNS